MARERPATDLYVIEFAPREALGLLGLLPRSVARRNRARLKTMQFCHDMAELHGSSREGTCDVSIVLFERRCHKTLFRSGNAKPGGLYSPSTHSRLHRLQGSVRLSGGDSISLMRIHGH
jgi:hypothetical protein